MTENPYSGCNRAELNSVQKMHERAAEFAVGSIVRLKSGSPPLTVCHRKQGGDDIVGVEWFVDGIVHRDSFYKECLERWPPIPNFVPIFKDKGYAPRAGEIDWMT